jgi:hypothetical protein
MLIINCAATIACGLCEMYVPQAIFLFSAFLALAAVIYDGE